MRNHHKQDTRSPVEKSLIRARDRWRMKKAFRILDEDSPFMRKIRLKEKCPFLQHSRGKQMDVIFNNESRRLMFKPF